MNSRSPSPLAEPREVRRSRSSLRRQVRRRGALGAGESHVDGAQAAPRRCREIVDGSGMIMMMIMGFSDIIRLCYYF